MKATAPSARRSAGSSLFRAWLLAAFAAALAPGSAARAGDLNLSYAMAEAGGEQVPYRVYLPQAWTPEREWPLVVILHGYASSADRVFEEAGDRLREAAERHGFVLLAPNGYNGMADYGANLPLPSTLSRMGQDLRMTPEAESALAEADVRNVMERAMADYRIDPERVYLMGNSMGMTGVLHLAAKMPEQWCAISASGGPPWPDYPVERLAPIKGALFVHGGRDDRARVPDTQGLAERAAAAGVNARFHLVPEGTHGSAWIDYLPETMQFLADVDCTPGAVAP